MHDFPVCKSLNQLMNFSYHPFEALNLSGKLENYKAILLTTFELGTLLFNQWYSKIQLVRLASISGSKVLLPLGFLWQPFLIHLLRLFRGTPNIFETDCGSLSFQLRETAFFFVSTGTLLYGPQLFKSSSMLFRLYVVFNFICLLSYSYNLAESSELF